MYKWNISVVVDAVNAAYPDVVWRMYRSLFNDAGFTVMPFVVNAGRIGYTIDFTILHAKPSALTHFILRYPRLEFTVTEL